MLFSTVSTSAALSLPGNRLAPHWGNGHANGHCSVQPLWLKMLPPTHHTEQAAIGLGGSGAGLDDLARLAPGLHHHIQVLDSDIKILEDCGLVKDLMHLSCDGSMRTILNNRSSYSLLQRGVPETIEAFETTRGVGKIRVAATVLLAYNVDAVKSRVRKLVERILARFRGPGPKRLIFHLVFSLGGGTGSSLAIPVGALALDLAASISPALEIVLHGHAISPNLHLGFMTTPADRQRTEANAAMALHELFLAQQAGSLDELTEALQIEPISRPLLDSLAFYDVCDSGGGLQSLDDVRDRVNANIVASGNQGLLSLESARDINPAMAQRGCGASELGTAIIEVRHTRAIVVPVEKLAQLHAHRNVAARLQAIGLPTAAENFEAARQHVLLLRSEAARREVLDKLRPDRKYHLPAAIDRMTTGEVLQLAERTMERWNRHGRPEMLRTAQALLREKQAEAAARCDEFWEAARTAAQSVPGLVCVLREALVAIEERQSSVRQELEARAGRDDAALLRAATARLAGAWWWWRRAARNNLRNVVNQLVDAQAEQEGLRVYLEGYLAPLRGRLQAHLEATEARACELEAALRQLELQIPQLEQAIGLENAFHSEIVRQNELRSVAAHLDADVPPLPAETLSLPRLLGGSRDESLADILQAAGQTLQARAAGFMRDETGDIQGFIEHFGIGFSIGDWLSSALQITLPARLDLGGQGPGNNPMQVYLAGPAALENVLMRPIREMGNVMGVEWCQADNPFELTLRAKISRAPFRSIPGLVRMQRAYRDFLATAPKDNVWGELSSHGSLSKAHEVDPSQSVAKPLARQAA